MSTNVSSVVSHFPDVENGFTTTLASTIASGATTVPLNSVGGYTNGEPAVFVVDPSDATKKQTFTGIIDTSGVQVTNVVWTAGTDQTHTGGATVVDYATATHIAMISKGIKVHADQDGTLKSGAVDNASVLASGVVTEPKLADNSVDSRAYVDGSIDPEHLLTGTGTTWAWQSWTPTWTNLTVGNGTLVARYIQVGKIVCFRLTLTFGSTSSVSGNVYFTPPVNYNSGYNLRTVIGDVSIEDAGTASYFGYVRINDAAPVLLQCVLINVGGTYAAVAAFSSTAPMTWTTGDQLMITGTYEAA